MSAGLYLHVPFCRGKCPYCAFFSRPAATQQLLRAWLDGLRREREEWVGRGVGAGWSPDTLYMGGGTPSILPLDVWKELLGFLHDTFDLSRVREWTVEANPASLTPQLAALLRDAGVNRISLGAQSFSPDRLRFLGRPHDVPAIADAARCIRATGFAHFSVDVMFGVPGETVADALEDADAAIALGPDHLSFYALEIEPGTFAARRWPPVSEEAQADAYHALRAFLADRGFAQYEISNFARPGGESRHNLLYWTGGEYVGLGPAAHSHWCGTRRGNTATLPEWHVEFEETLPPERKARETLVFGLRRTAGWTAPEFRAATGFDWDDVAADAIRRQLDRGALLLDSAPGGPRLRLSPDWLFLSDDVFSDLV